MPKSTIALVLFIVAAILAVIASVDPPHYSRLLALAVALTAAGLAVEAA